MKLLIGNIVILNVVKLYAMVNKCAHDVLNWEKEINVKNY